MKSEEEIAALIGSDELRDLIGSVRPGCDFREPEGRDDCSVDAVYQLDLFCPTGLETISVLACVGHRNYFLNEVLPMINDSGHGDDHVVNERLLA